MINNQSSPPDVVGIGEAAAALGLSRGTVQKMVDGGELAAVRTHGGHRRISRESLEKYLSRSVPSASQADESLCVLVAEDNDLMRHQYEWHVQRSNLPVRLVFAGDAIEALLAIERQRPHVVVADLCMRPFDGFHLVSKLRTTPEFAEICVVVVTALTAVDIQARGQELPPSVPVFEKPAPWDRLLGLLQGQIQSRLGLRLDRVWREARASSASAPEAGGTAGAKGK
jgi:excisionase family DNA binding protein